jgi:hypothetical protein
MADMLQMIPNMSTTQKLAAMESLWASLHRNIEETPPPEWHREILAQRLAKIETGEATYQDWSEVKKELRARIS